MAKNTEKDREMAKHLREIGDKREYARCPVCATVISIKAVYNHIAFHK